MRNLGSISHWTRTLDFYRGTVIHVRWFPLLAFIAVLLGLLGLLMKKR